MMQISSKRTCILSRKTQYAHLLGRAKWHTQFIAVLTVSVRIKFIKHIKLFQFKRFSSRFFANYLRIVSLIQICAGKLGRSQKICLLESSPCQEKTASCQPLTHNLTAEGQNGGRRNNKSTLTFAFTFSA